MGKLPAPRVLRGVALGLAIPALMLGLVSLPWRADRPEEAPRVIPSSCGPGTLRAGAGEAAFDVPAGAPLAGFARFRWASEGVRDPVGARALVLEAPGCRLAIVSAEILIVPDALEAAVRKRVQHLGLNGLVLAATHTHSSPGGYWNNVFGEHVGTAPFEPRMQEVIVAGIAESIGRALAAVGPAELAVGRRRLEQLVRNRSGGAEEGRLMVARLTRPGGEPVAELIVFAAHPTTLGKRNHQISGDWPGRFLRRGDRGLRLLLQGAIGDQSARLPDGEPMTPETYGDALSREVDELPLEKIPQPGLSFASADVVLPAPSPGALPPLLRSAARNLAYESLPDTARVFAVRLGPATLALVPAEPVADVADAWRADAGAEVEIVSLAGGYVGYVEAPDVMEDRAGESARTYYGPELAARLAHGISAAAKGLAGDAL